MTRAISRQKLAGRVGDDAAEAVELAGEDVAFAGLVDVGRCVDEAGEADVGEGGLGALVVQTGEEAAGPGPGEGDEEEVQEGHFVVVEVGVELGFNAEGGRVEAVEAEQGVGGVEEGGEARVLQGEQVVQEPDGVAEVGEGVAGGGWRWWCEGGRGGCWCRGG